MMIALASLQASGENCVQNIIKADSFLINLLSGEQSISGRISSALCVQKKGGSGWKMHKFSWGRIISPKNHQHCRYVHVLRASFCFASLFLLRKWKLIMFWNVLRVKKIGLLEIWYFLSRNETGNASLKSSVNEHVRTCELALKAWVNSDCRNVSKAIFMGV